MTIDTTNHRGLSILGIARSPRFSPNSVARDQAIFEAVARGLRQEGYAVTTCNEDEFSTCSPATIVFSMARSKRVLQTLALAEQQGARIINSPTALLRNSRVRLFDGLAQAAIAVAPFCSYPPHGTQAPFDFPFWLKRSEDCAQSAQDVQFIDSTEALNKALEYFAQHHIDEVFCCKHLEGDLVKFYGVAGTNFFHAYYPTANGDFSKFGLEAINGTPNGYPIDWQQLKTTADRAAEQSHMLVYGGDGVVAADGSFRIIDFNDWPSFSRCYQEAAWAIVEKIKTIV